MQCIIAYSHTCDEKWHLKTINSWKEEKVQYFIMHPFVSKVICLYRYVFIYYEVWIDFIWHDVTIMIIGSVWPKLFPNQFLAILAWLKWKNHFSIGQNYQMVSGLHSDLNQFETAFAKFQLCMDFFWPIKHFLDTSICPL